MEQLVLILVNSITILAAVIVGYGIANKKPKEPTFDKYEVEPESVSDGMIKKIFTGEYFKNEEEPKETVSDKIDRSKRHAFYD